ncbi:MAG: hypothetical protein LBD58_01630 [Treponema sp.]|jgi:hypothetical protein|nr:hypothetical protein [Treponema sp.]
MPDNRDICVIGGAKIYKCNGLLAVAEGGASQNNPNVNAEVSVIFIRQQAADNGFCGLLSGRCRLLSFFICRLACCVPCICWLSLVACSSRLWLM